VPSQLLHILTFLHIGVLVCRCPLGEDWTEKVAKASIKCKWIKLASLLKEHSTNEE
jgi:hypothetical protein